MASVYKDTGFVICKANILKYSLIKVLHITSALLSLWINYNHSIQNIVKSFSYYPDGICTIESHSVNINYCYLHNIFVCSSYTSSCWSNVNSYRCGLIEETFVVSDRDSWVAAPRAVEPSRNRPSEDQGQVSEGPRRHTVHSVPTPPTARAHSSRTSVL